MQPRRPVYTPRRSFSPITVKEIRLATKAIRDLRKIYDLDEIEARLLTQADTLDHYGRVTE